MTLLSRRRFAQLAAGALAAPALAGRAHAAGVIRLGGTVSMTGTNAESGQDLRNGYETAVRYFNEMLRGIEIGDTRYTIVLRLEDDEGDPDRAQQLLERQFDDGIEIVLGSFGSRMLLPTAALVARAGKLMVEAGGAADALFTSGNRRIFGLFPRASRQFVTSINWFAQLDPRPQSAVVLRTEEALSQRLAESAAFDLKDAGFQLRETQPLPAQITDVSDVMSAIRSMAPTMVISVTQAANSLAIARQMIATGTDAPIVYQALGPRSASFREALGANAEGIAVPVFWDPRMTYRDEFFGSAQEFADYYATVSDRPITDHVAAAGACVVCCVKAMQNATTVSDLEAIRAAIAALDFETFYGRIRFTPQGDGDPQIMGPAIGQIRDGEVAVVYPDAAAFGSALYPKPDWKGG